MRFSYDEYPLFFQLTTSQAQLQRMVSLRLDRGGAAASRACSAKISPRPSPLANSLRETYQHRLEHRLTASSAESCIRKAVGARGLTPDLVGLADAKAEDEAAMGTAFALRVD